MTTNGGLYSSMVRSGKTTYFVDVREAKNGSKFISIAETKFDDDKRQRTTVRVFGDSIEQFKQAINDAAAAAVVQ